MAPARRAATVPRGVAGATVTGMVLVVGLFLLSRQDYILFHSMVELFAAAVAMGLFLLVWSARGFLGNDALTFLGIAYFFVAFLGLIHTLAYKGTGLFPAERAADLATQLWIAARYMESVSLLLFTVMLGRRLRPISALAAYGIATALLLAAILVWRIFPPCFVEGVGLNRFKIVSEVLICLILGAALLLLQRRRGMLDPAVHRILSAAIGFAIGAELAFTFYVDVYDLSNFARHILKLLSFLLIYLALIRSGLTKPYATLFQELAQSEKNLREEQAVMKAIFSATPDFLVLKNRESVHLKANRAFCAFLGLSQQEIVGRTDADLFPADVAGRFLAEDAEVIRAGKGCAGSM
jgi:PAS domain-containing protein